MEKENQLTPDTNAQEHIDLFRKILDSEEGMRAKTVRFLDTDIATPLQVLRLNIDNCLKESEGNPQTTHYLNDNLKIIGEVFDVIRVLMHELYPNFINVLGLETTLKDYSRRLSGGMARIINFESTIPEKKLDAFEKDLQNNIYRIYAACHHHFVFDIQAVEFTVKLSLQEDTFCFDFLVDKTNPYVKASEKFGIEKRHPFDLEIVRARLMLLGGHIAEQTDWTNRLILFFPVQQKSGIVFENS